MKRRRIFVSAIVAAVAAFGLLFAAEFSAAEPAADLHGLGVVYLHGKGGWPGALNGGILGALKDEGALVATPEMPWSFHRRYDATFDQALAEIDAAIAGLKSDGAHRIVLIGVSLGANAAIGYAARHPELVGVVALAPGHLPDVGNMRSFVSDAVARAKTLIAEGKGDVRQSFPDMAQGIPLTATATPTVYLSWFDPEGPAVIPKNAALMGAAPSPAPLLWVVGKLDPIDRRGPEYAFNALAKNPKSRICRGHCRAPHDGAGGARASDRLDQCPVSSALWHSCATRRSAMKTPEPDRPVDPAKIFPVSWDQFHRDSRALAWRLSGTGPFDAIVCITRGGLVPAAIVARELDIRVIETVCVASYDHTRQTDVTISRTLQQA